MASKDEALRWLDVLGLAPGATNEQLDDAYRDLVKVWHPDRFQSDPALRLKAQEKLRDLNAAYEGLRRSGIPPAPKAAPPPPPAWKKGPATPENRSARWGMVWGFGAVLVATAAVVAIVLSIGMRRDTVVPTDVVLAPAPQPRKPPREPQRSEPAPPPRPTVGALIVLSEPSGGTVYVNNEQVGHTPLTLPSLAPGEYRVRVELGNYSPWSAPVQIDAGASEKLIAFMEKRGAP